jgi:hypothetical protein
MTPVRLTAFLLLLMGWLGSGGTSARAQETGLDGNVYTNATYGFSIEFDDEVWTATEIEQRIGEGVAFEPIEVDGELYAQFRVEYDDVTDPEECLEIMVSDYREVGPWDAFKEDSNLPAPESASDVVSVTIAAEAEDGEDTLYMECRPVNGGTMNAVLGGDAALYEEWLPEFEELLAGVTVDSAVQDDGDDTGTPDDNDQDSADDENTDRSATFADIETGWALTYDKELWSLVEVAEFFRQGVRLTSTDENVHGFVLMLASTARDLPVEECVGNVTRNLQTNENYRDITEADDLDAPRTDQAAVGALFTATDISGDEEIEVAYYIECREISNGILFIEMAVDLSRYEDTVPLWEDLLSGIDTGLDGSDDDEDGDQDQDRNTDTDTDQDTGNAQRAIDGNTYTDTEFGYEVTWDEDVWAVEEIETDLGGIYLTIAEEPVFATVTIDASSGYTDITPEECVDAYVESLPDVGPFSDFEEADDLELPETDRDATGVVYRYTYTFEDGQEAEFVGYMECRPITEDVMIRVFLQTDEASYEDELALFEELLAGIEITDAGATDDTDTGDDSDETDAGDDTDGTDTDTRAPLLVRRAA